MRCTQNNPLWRRLRSSLKKALLLTCVITATPVFAAEHGSGVLARSVIGIGGQMGSSSTLNFSDVRPSMHERFLGHAEIGYAVVPNWTAIAAMDVGGSWFEFSGRAASGNIVNSDWILRMGVDRRKPREGLYYGFGGVYGESWSRLRSDSVEEPGPHAYVTGGYFTLGAAGAMLGRLQGYGELISTAYLAHARDASGSRFRWVGQSFDVGIGIRIPLGGLGAAGTALERTR